MALRRLVLHSRVSVIHLLVVNPVCKKPGYLYLLGPSFLLRGRQASLMNTVFLTQLQAARVHAPGVLQQGPRVLSNKHADSGLALCTQ